MYHVTKQENQPNWETVNACSIANDDTYDGDLLGLPLASFTTTLNEYEDGTIELPDISPYPRNQPSKRASYCGKYYRVQVRFNMDDYHIFLMKEHTYEHKGKSNTQVQLLCIRRSDDERNKVEDEVYGILLNHFKDAKLTEQQLQKYFPGKRANVYKSYSSQEIDRRFINVHFTFDIDIRIPESGAKWDFVTKTGTITSSSQFLGIDLNDLRSLWCMEHHYKTLNAKIMQLEETNYKIWKIMKPSQSQLKKSFDEWENTLINKLGRIVENTRQ